MAISSQLPRELISGQNFFPLICCIAYTEAKPSTEQSPKSNVIFTSVAKVVNPIFCVPFRLYFITKALHTKQILTLQQSCD